MDGGAQHLGRKVAQNHASRDHGSKARKIRVGRGNVSDWTPRMGPDTGHSDRSRIICRLNVRMRPLGKEHGTGVLQKKRGNDSQHPRGRLRCNRNHHRDTRGYARITRITYEGNDRACSSGHGWQCTRSYAQRATHEPSGNPLRTVPPSLRCEETRLDRNRRAIHTCKNCTKDWVTHAAADCLGLAANKENRKEGWTSYFM